MNNYKEMKVFSNLPGKVGEAFFDKYDDIGNGCYVRYEIYDSGVPIEIIDESKCMFSKNINLHPNTNEPIIDEWITDGVRYVIQKGNDIISDWLVDNGAVMGESVLIDHSW
jgi:hypothetical protein